MISNQSKDDRDPIDRGALQEQLIQFQQETSMSETLTEEVFSLLEERLIVNLSRRKLGEIVIRKEIETQILQVEVPVQREKLIVEQVSPEYQLLAQIDLGRSNSVAIDSAIDDRLRLADNDKKPISTRLDRHEPKVSGELDSLKAASDLLNEIANMPAADWETVRIEIVLKDAKHQDNYQALFDRYCHWMYGYSLTCVKLDI